MNESTDLRLAFMDICLFDDGTLRGGVLVTDIETKPYEFRATSPVKPTRLQEILYGSSLREYVYGELICLPLLKAVKENLSLVLAKDRNLLAIRPALSFPMVIVQRGQGPISADDAEERAINPVIIIGHRNYSGEEAQANIILSTLMQHKDLLEPFERVRIALSEIHKQRLGEKETHA